MTQQFQTLTDNEIRKIKTNLVKYHLSNWEYDQYCYADIGKYSSLKIPIVTCVKNFDTRVRQCDWQVFIKFFSIMVIAFCVAILITGYAFAYIYPESFWAEVFRGHFVTNTTTERNTELIKDMEVSDVSAPVLSVDDSYTYYRDKLDKESAAVYDNLYNAISNKDNVAKFESCVQKEKLNLIMTCLLADHPEMFWFEGRGNYNSFENTFTPIYEFESDEISQMKERMEYAVNDVKSYMDSEMKLKNGIEDNAFGRAYLVSEYIADITSYNLDSEHNQSIYSVFENGESVCAGYSKAMVYLSRELGVPAIYVFGDAYGDVDGSGEDFLGKHAWVMFIDEYGVAHYCDPTWYDNNNWSRNQAMFDAGIEFADTHKAQIR